MLARGRFLKGAAVSLQLVLGNRDRDDFIGSMEADDDPNQALIRAAQDFNRRHGDR